MISLNAITPAKVNLGLEVLRRREDGYHDLVTIMQAMSLYDHFVWTETCRSFEYVGPEGVAREVDLVWRALSLAQDINRWTGRLRVVKRIPMAAGMGGGSSDAALALRLALPDATTDELHLHAAALGADVPFFLAGGAALATGIGISLVPIRTSAFWLVLITPQADIPNKTATLYRGLESGDFTDGTAIHDIVEQIGRCGMLERGFPNAFLRQLLGYPSIRYAYDCLRRTGVELVSVSGAGPSLYAAVTSWRKAVDVASRLPVDVGIVRIARTLSQVGASGKENAPARRIATALRGSAPSHS